MRQSLLSRSVQVLFVLFVWAAWFGATQLHSVSQVLLPDPGKVGASMIALARSGQLWIAARVTLYEILRAYLLAVIPGLAIGFVVSRSRWAVRFLEPIFSGIFTVPLTLFLPLFIFFFGIGPTAKVAFGGVYAFFPVVITALAAFSGVERLYVSAARSMGSSFSQLFWRVYLPAAWPGILSGLRIATLICIGAVLGGETISSASGLGHAIANASELMNTADMYAWVLYVVIVALLINGLLSVAEERAGRRA